MLLILVLIASAILTIMYDASKESKVSNETSRFEIPLEEEKNAHQIKEIEDRSVKELEKPEAPKYRIQMQFDPEHNQLVGRSQIKVWNRTNATTSEMNIQLHLNAFRENQALPVLDQFAKKAYPAGNKFGGIDIESVKVDGYTVNSQIEGTLLNITLDKPWIPQQSKVIVLVWKADIPVVHHRVGVDKGRWWFGNALPILSVFDGQWRTNRYEIVGDPFFSEASDYIVEIETPSGFEVVATGVETVEQRENRRITKIQAYNVREFAFAIGGNLKFLSEESESGVVVGVYYKKAKDENIQALLSLASEFVDDLSARLVPYPTTELDVFENEMFITGMEYPELVFIDSDRLNSPTGAETFLHEIAHQWFYNMIGTNPINEPWLDEGLATYYVDRFLQRKGLKSTYTDQSLASITNDTEHIMKSVTEYRSWGEYWRANYRKASYELFQIERRMGEIRFDRMMKELVTEFQYKIVTTEDLERIGGKYLSGFQLRF